MGSQFNGFNSAVYLVLLVLGSSLVSGAFDRPYLGSPKAPRNLLRPSPSKEKFATRAVSKDIPKAPESAYRLPTALNPIHYVVRLQPFINGNFSILGHVEIEVEVLEPTSNITVNLHAITTFDDTIKVTSSGGGASIGVLSTTLDDVHQLFVVDLAEELQQGQNYIFSMDFEGLLDINFYGFYRGTSRDENGTVVYHALTQFEPVGARRAFPCFDEPSLKATFDITLGREDTMTALANTPIRSTSPIEGQPGWSWDSYETTVVMPTYLLAFVVSDFPMNTTTTASGMPFGVGSRRHKLPTAQYALDKGPDVLDFYGIYLENPFPLSKMDMVASTDFLGAMENWGLVLYSENTMLFDPEVDSLVDQQYVMEVIAHELAHQWFGDLVTTAWWSHIWLNEGFAQYLQYNGVDACEPTWNYKDFLLTDEQQLVFEFDSVAILTHPMIVNVQAPLEIDLMFDTVTYSKGASINRMQNNILTEATHVRGLINYLNMYQYSNAYQDYLFEHLTNAGHVDGTLPSDMTMKQVMDTWTLQGGYPVITVNRSADGTSAVLSQKRFWSNHVDTNETWWVPITYTSQDSPNFDSTQPSLWMSDTDLEISVDSLPSQDQWVIFNIQETGYYRVNYDDNNWALLLQQLDTNPDAIHPLNRAQINDDFLEFSRAGLLSYSDALEMLKYLHKEASLIPLTSALNKLDYLDTMLMGTKEHDAFKSYLLDLLLPLYEEMGFYANTDASPQEQYMHMITLAWVCDLGYVDCVRNSINLFDLWMQNPENKRIIHPNMKKTVYCTAIAEGGEREWDFAWSQYFEAESLSEKYRLLEALGCSRDSALLMRYLEMAFSEDSDIKTEDIMMVFTSVAKNPTGRDVAWDFLRFNGRSATKYILPKKSLADMVNIVSETFNSQEQKNQLGDFQRIYSRELSAVDPDVILFSVDRNIGWMNSHYHVITQWLLDNGYGNSDHM